MNARDFDYGVGDDIDDAVQHLRAEIVERIRRAANADIDAPRQVHQAYQIAIQIAQGER